MARPRVKRPHFGTPRPGLAGKFGFPVDWRAMPDPVETPKPLLTQTFPASVLARLREAGFDVSTVSSSPERIRVLKHNCASVFEKQGEGLRLIQAPGYVFRGEIARLWDAGYQKFWLLGPPSDEPFNLHRRPALAAQLKDLQRHSEELQQVLGIPSFYNESIGTTSKVTAYDRVLGRGSTTRQRFS